MSRAYFRLCILALGIFLVPRGARAGAFMLPEGEGQFIAGVGYSQGSRRFEKSGETSVAPAFSKALASGYLEYGLTSTITLIAAPTLSREHDGPATNAVTGSDGSAFGVRLQLYGAPGRVVAVQALFQPPVHGARDLAGDIRLMLGQSFPIYGWTGFVDLEPGFRVRADPYPTEARLDIAAGVRPVERVLLLLQDFISVAPRVGAWESVAYSKAQASVVYDISKTWSVQLGAFRTIAGRNIIRETGPMGALWYRF